MGPARIERLACVFVSILKGGSTTESKVSGQFKLEISGRPISRAAVNSIKELITPRVKKIDRDVQIDIRLFSDIAMIITWTGIPKNFGSAQPLITALKAKMAQYFQEWEYSFKIKLNETGE